SGQKLVEAVALHLLGRLAPIRRLAETLVDEPHQQGRRSGIAFVHKSLRIVLNEAHVPIGSVARNEVGRLLMRSDAAGYIPNRKAVSGHIVEVVGELQT